MLAYRRKSQCIQARLSLLGHPGKNHGNVVTRVFIARAGDHHSIAVKLPRPTRGLQGESHFRPRRKWRRAAELDAVLMENDRTRSKGQTRLPRLDRDMMQ